MWVTILLSILSLLVGFFINILANIYTPSYTEKIKAWRETRVQNRAKKNIESANKEIKKVETELAELRGYVENPLSFKAYIFGKFSRILMSILLSILIIFFILYYKPSDVFQPFGNIQILFFIMSALLGLLIGIGYDSAIKAINLADKMHRFSEYEAKNRKKIEDLQKTIDGIAK